jgi:UrcA family protein
MTVAYGDLDMSTVNGGKTLLTRIQSAARKVCGDSDAYSPLHPRSETQCRRATVASVVNGLGIGTLTQAFNGGKSAASQIASND